MKAGHLNVKYTCTVMCTCMCYNVLRVYINAPVYMCTCNSNEYMYIIQEDMLKEKTRYQRLLAKKNDEMKSLMDEVYYM